MSVLPWCWTCYSLLNCRGVSVDFYVLDWSILNYPFDHLCAWYSNPLVKNATYSSLIQFHTPYTIRPSIITLILCISISHEGTPVLIKHLNLNLKSWSSFFVWKAQNQATIALTKKRLCPMTMRSVLRWVVSTVTGRVFSCRVITILYQLIVPSPWKLSGGRAGSRQRVSGH